MKKQENLSFIMTLGMALILSGCVVRTYPLTRERVDQDLTTGNRGYLQGRAPEGTENKERKTTRTTQVVEVELRAPLKFEKKAKAPEIKEEASTSENKGFVNQDQTAAATPQAPEVKMEKYTVLKGDTLQKISLKFYGTTKKWTKIYDANKDTLKGPNKIYPGRSINIPVEPAKEPQANLK